MSDGPAGAAGPSRAGPPPGTPPRTHRAWSLLRGASLQVYGHVIGRHDPAGAQVVQAGVHVTQQVVVEEHLDRLAQPLDLTGWHDVGDMAPVREHRRGLPALGAGTACSHDATDRVQVVTDAGRAGLRDEDEARVAGRGEGRAAGTTVGGVAAAPIRPRSA
jgi:hypothetical protein